MNQVDEKFLVRLDDGQFMVDVDGNSVTTTEIPSRAAHVTYAVADQFVQRFKRRGFPQCVVTDHLGTSMTYSEIQSELRTDSLPKTRVELAKIPVSVQRTRYKDDAAFRKRVDELEGQA